MRIRLLCINAVLCEAERALAAIAEQYFSPNLSLKEEMRGICSRRKTGLSGDSLKHAAPKTEIDPLRLLGIQLLPSIVTTAGHPCFAHWQNISADGAKSSFLHNESNRGELRLPG